MAKPTILFYNLDNARGKTLKMICLKHKIRIKNISKEQYTEAIGTLAGLLVPQNNDSPISAGTDFDDEMLIFCDFHEQLLDAFLLEFKKNRLKRIALKAVLTEQNILWDSYRLHDELVKEHNAMNPQET